MQVRTGVGVLFLAQFTESKVGKTGLTVMVNVYRVNTSGAASTVVTGGSATEVGKGVYSYMLSSGSNTTAGVLVAVFITATTSVDQQEIPAAWGIELPAPAHVLSLASGSITATEAPNLDAAVSTRLASASYSAPPSTSAIASAVVGQTIGIQASGTVGHSLLMIDANVSTRLASASYTSPPSAATIAAQVIAETIEGSLDLAEVLRILLAACAGRASGLSGTTATYKSVDGNTSRIVATVDEYGNRSAVTLNGA